MPFYGRDFYGDEAVKGMNHQQRSWYLMLLWHQWEHESLPDDASIWYGTINPRVAPDDPQWESFIPTIERLFPRDGDGRRRNRKNAEVRGKHIAIMRTRQLAGQKGGRASAASRGG
jgi:hypothetical protein